MTLCASTGIRGARTIPGRHTDTCPGETCPGCAPCPEPHCPVCRRAHHDGACPACVGHTRDDLATIATQAPRLGPEAVHRGITSTAAMLHGPAAHPEAWRNRAAAALFGRGDPAYLADNRDEPHPLWVLTEWADLWRDHLDQPTDLAPTLPRVVAYLTDHLGDMAAVTEPPFVDAANAIRAVRAHVVAVLGDRPQGDRAGVGCFDCGGPLERALTATGFADTWTCLRCRRAYTPAEYHLALRAAVTSRVSVARRDT